MTPQLGELVGWKAIGGPRQGRVLALASDLESHAVCVAVGAHWGQLWIDARERGLPC